MDGNGDLQNAEPYSDELETSGVLYFSDQELNEFVLRAHQAGLQISMHAIGDRAIHQLLSAYEQAASAWPRPDPRHRIEHYSMATREHIRRSAELGLCVSIQTALLTYQGEDHIFRHRLGEARFRQMYKLADIVAAGVTVVGGSDSFIGPMNPLLSVHGAVNHVIPEQSLTPYQALLTGTRNPAAFFGRPDEFGTVQPGRRADLVLLEDNPLRDIANFDRQAGVMVRGRWLPAGEIRRRLEALAAGT